jgi:hypothetical protein
MDLAGVVSTALIKKIPLKVVPVLMKKISWKYVFVFYWIKI